VTAFNVIKMLSKEKLVEILSAITAPERVSIDDAELYCYSYDASVHRCRPDAVVWPENAEEISRIVRFANEYRIPVIPRGAATGDMGGALAIKGGIIVDLTRMNKIKEVRIEDLQVTVEPGVVFAQLNQELGKYGFFFPPEPGSGDACTIGGMVACNASGLHAVKYGVTRDYVLSLEVVLPNGRIIRTGPKVLKTATGYDLTRLFVGSEGTLGIITEITLRIRPLPRHFATAVATFDDLIKAGKAVSQIMKSGIVPSALEIMDKLRIQAVNQVMNLALPEAEGTLLIEVDGHPDAIQEEINLISRICQDEGAVSVVCSTDPKEREKLWAGRKAAYAALIRLYKPHIKPIQAFGNDIVVPVSKVPLMLQSIQDISRKHNILIATMGHIGDGNLHPTIMIDVTRKEDWEKAKAAGAEIYQTAIELGGSIAGEHAIGITRAPFIELEHADLIEHWKRIKQAFDPNNIMNPGKIGLDTIPKDPLVFLAYAKYFEGKTDAA
jgi:glycolate oxidase